MLVLSIWTQQVTNQCNTAGLLIVCMLYSSIAVVLVVSTMHSNSSTPLVVSMLIDQQIARVSQYRVDSTSRSWTISRSIDSEYESYCLVVLHSIKVYTSVLAVSMHTCTTAMRCTRSASGCITRQLGCPYWSIALFHHTLSGYSSYSCICVELLANTLVVVDHTVCQ